MDPTPRQEQALWSHAGAARFAFNIALLHIRSQLSGCTPVQDKGRADWSMPALRRWWNEWKREIAPWWNENSKEAYNTGLQSLSDAFSNYFDSRSGTRRGNTIMNARTGYTDFRGIHDMKNIAAVDTHRTVWDTMNIGQHFLAYANATYDTLAYGESGEAVCESDCGWWSAVEAFATGLFQDARSGSRSVMEFQDHTSGTGKVVRWGG